MLSIKKGANMKIKNLILNILIVIFAGIAIFSGIKVFNIQKETQKSADDFNKLEQLTENTNENENLKYKTSAEKYADLHEMNEHFVGWITIPGTLLNYPVVQTKDSPEYYLRRNFEGEYSFSGVPFVDYKCTIDESDNTIIYGHNMKNKTMFSAVENYESQDYWKEHKYIGFDTLNDFGLYEVVTSFRIDTSNTDFYYSEITNFSNENEFNNYISNAKSLETYSTDVTASYGNKLLTLSTCEYTYADGAGRYVLIAKKISNEDIATIKLEK